MKLKSLLISLLVRFGRPIPDITYLKLAFRLREGYWMDFDNPRTLNEKLQWLKIHNRDERYAVMVDKYEVKKYVASVIGEGYLIPTIGVYDNPGMIDFGALPESFVLKATHNSGEGRFICQNKQDLNADEVRRMLKKALSHNYYYCWREWPYKNVRPRIICEKYIQNADGTPIVDYKFYCFNGEPVYFMYSMGEADHHVRNCKFDLDGNDIDFHFKKKRALQDDEIKLPGNLDEMVAVVRKLCAGMPHVRVDLYNVDGHIYFGELTFYTNDGFINIEDQSFAQYLADLIDITPYK